MSFWKFEKSLPMPDLIIRWTRIVEWSAVLVFLSYVLFILLIGRLTLWFLLVLLCGLAIPLIQLRVLRPIAKRARQANLELCQSCGHPFSGDQLQDCEQCNRPIVPVETRKLWRTTVLRFQRGGAKSKIPALKRWRVIACLIAGITLPFICMFIGVQYIAYSVQQNSNLPNGTGYLLAIPAFTIQLLFVIIAIILGFGIRRKLNLAQQHGFLMCGRCLFPLDDIADAGTCPECGAPFQKDDLRRRWYESWVNRRNFREAIKMDIPLVIRDDAKA